MELKAHEISLTEVSLTGWNPRKIFDDTALLRLVIVTALEQEPNPDLQKLKAILPSGAIQEA